MNTEIKRQLKDFGENYENPAYVTFWVPKSGITNYK